MKKMKIALLAVLSVFCFMGCTQYPTYEVNYRKVIPAEKKAEAAKYILDLVAAANPYSDEEPEDNIIQAERTAGDLFGEFTIGLKFKASAGAFTVFIPYDQCSTRQKGILTELSIAERNAKR